MGSQIVCGGVAYDAPDLHITNFLVGGVSRFHNQTRKGPITEFVFHETVTSSARATVDVLLQRKLGVHFICGADGQIYQHGDAVTDLLWHASEHNPQSVGLEVVNPYYPAGVPHGGPWMTIIDAPWAHQGKYVVPLPVQAEAAVGLLRWFLSPPAGAGVAIPAQWPGVSGAKLAMGRTAKSALGPGVYAHMYFGHADGAWLVLYAWLRLVANLVPDAAYEEAVKLATGAHGAVDLPAVLSA